MRYLNKNWGCDKIELTQLPLLDKMSRKMGCPFLSDLRFLSREQRKQLVRSLKQIEPEANSLCEWNDALAYLTGAPPEETAAEAKERLVCLLSQF